jgi:hypothetical protein
MNYSMEKHPLKGRNMIKFKKQLLKNEIVFNAKLNPLVKDLILRILKLNQEERPTVY